MNNRIRKIVAFRPCRSAVRLAAKQAFNYSIAYGDAWQQFKQKHRLDGQLCERCAQQPAKTRHHLIPISKGGRHRRSDIVMVCTACHELFHPHLQRRKYRRRI